MLRTTQLIADALKNLKAVPHHPHQLHGYMFDCPICQAIDKLTVAEKVSIETDKYVQELRSAVPASFYEHP